MTKVFGKFIEVPFVDLFFFVENWFAYVVKSCRPIETKKQSKFFDRHVNCAQYKSGGKLIKYWKLRIEVIWDALDLLQSIFFKAVDKQSRILLSNQNFTKVLVVLELFV